MRLTAVAITPATRRQLAASPHAAGAVILPPGITAATLRRGKYPVRFHTAHRAAGHDPRHIAAAFLRTGLPRLVADGPALSAVLSNLVAAPVFPTVAAAIATPHTPQGLTRPATPQFARFNVDAHLRSIPYHPIRHDLAAVTCHFNPQRSAARLRCYEQFARQFPALGLRLYCAEGSPDHRYEILDSWHFPMDPEAHLFAKENLLNLAINRLPDQYERVVWIDSDVLIITPHWAELLAAALDADPVVQGFQSLRYIGPHGEPETSWRDSLGWINARDNAAIAEPQAGYPGLVWAARRDVLAAGGGIYDRVITGGGDVAWCVGVWGDLRPRYSAQWSPALIADVHRWAAGIHPYIPSVGYVPAAGVHLYHGKLAARQYQHRNEILGQVGYDPQLHLEYGPTGTLRWSKAAPAELRNAVRAYIHGRREDE